MVEKVDLGAYRSDFYFSTFITGGIMVEKWIWKPPDVILSPKLTLDIWLIFFYFTIFLPEGKIVEKIDLDIQMWLNASNWPILTPESIIFRSFYFSSFLPGGGQKFI